MLKRTVVAAALSLAFLASGDAIAGKKEGVSMPDKVEVAGKKLVLNGMGVREATVMNINVYVAGLYLESKTSSAKQVIDADQVKVIHLYFVRDVDRSDIVEAWGEGFSKNVESGKLPALMSDLAKLNSWMSDFEEGETLTFTYVPKKGLTVTAKGKKKGTINSAAFGSAVFAVFFGKEPPNKGLKNGLLGK